MNDRTIGSLLADVPGARLLRGDLATPVTAVEHDSRRVAAGAAFVAVPGFTVDGHRFLPQAAAAGAALLVVQADHAAGDLPEGSAIVSVPESRLALSNVSAWFYGHPSREMAVIGVTGTDGKTTTCHLLTGVLEASDERAGRLGTVDTYLPGEQGKVGQRMSTPEANEVQALLRRMADAGCRYAIVESTSHGLALGRLADVEYDIAVFTNITGDHLDFHETFEAYRDAKSNLFAALDRSPARLVEKAAVVNAEDPSATFMLGRTSARPIRFGLETPDLEIGVEDLELDATGSSFTLLTPGGQARARINLPARFNVANALAAAGAGHAVGLDPATIARGLAAVRGVPGRMERVEAGQPFEVVVDYAHTGDAVRKVLEVLRQVAKGRLLLVVGAAGERDPGRRFGVGRAAAEGADFSIFTSEDPRSEDPGEIVREIARHAEGAGREPGRDFIEAPDRREAIREALRRANRGDIVVVAGKGHEQSIVYEGRELPWDDRSVVREELAALGFTA